MILEEILLDSFVRFKNWVVSVLNCKISLYILDKSPLFSIWLVEEPCRLQSMGLQRVGHNWATDTFQFCIHPPQSILRISCWSNFSTEHSQCWLYLLFVAFTIICHHIFVCSRSVYLLIVLFPACICLTKRIHLRKTWKGKMTYLGLGIRPLLSKLSPWIK